MISNRHLKPLLLLDQWLHYVDMEEILPLFKKTRKDFSIAKPSPIDLGNPEISQGVVDVVRETNMSRLQTIKSLNEIQHIFYISSTRVTTRRCASARFTTNYSTLKLVGVFNSERVSPRAAKSHTLTRSHGGGQVACSDLSTLLVRFLLKATCLISLFFRSQTWKIQKETLHGVLTTLGPALLRELVLAANSFQYAYLPIVFRPASELAAALLSQFR